MRKKHAIFAPYRSLSTVKPGDAKTGLKIFLVVIPKEDLSGMSQAKPSFDKTLDYKYCGVPGGRVLQRTARPLSRDETRSVNM